MQVLAGQKNITPKITKKSFQFGYSFFYTKCSNIPIDLPIRAPNQRENRHSEEIPATRFALAEMTDAGIWIRSG